MAFLSGCGAKKAVVKQEQPPVAEEPVEPAWHTCLIPNAQVTFCHDDDRITGNATMQVVRDSMCIIRVTAILGVEILRIEATPEGVVGIDRVHGLYARASYDEINALLTPKLTWEIMQQMCSAELPTGSETARLRYTMGDEQAELLIHYPARKLDVPVRMVAAGLDRYKQIDISKLL